MAKLGFDPQDYKDPQGFDPVPKGKYYLAAEKADLKDTRDGKGKFVNTMFDITRGEYAGRKLFINFNIFNNSEKAQQIGREQLSAWARACGKPQAADTDQLLGVEFLATVDIDPPKDGYGASNRITGWDSADPNAQKETPKASAGQGEKQVPGDAARQGPSTSSKPKAGGSAPTKNPWDD